MLDKVFDPAAIEPRLYEGWEASGAFSARPESPARPFTIMLKKIILKSNSFMKVEEKKRE